MRICLRANSSGCIGCLHEINVLESYSRTVVDAAAATTLTVNGDGGVSDGVTAALGICAVDGQLEVGDFGDGSGGFRAADVSEQINRHFASNSLGRIHGCLERLVPSRLSVNNGNCTNKNAVNVGVAFFPNIFIIWEQCDKVVGCYSHAIFRAVMQRKVKGVCLRINFKIRIKRTIIEVRIIVCCYVIITTISLAKGAIIE